MNTVVLPNVAIHDAQKYALNAFAGDHALGLFKGEYVAHGWWTKKPRELRELNSFVAPLEGPLQGIVRVYEPFDPISEKAWDAYARRGPTKTTSQPDATTTRRACSTVRTPRRQQNARRSTDRRDRAEESEEQADDV